MIVNSTVCILGRTLGTYYTPTRLESMWVMPCELAGCYITTRSYRPKKKSRDECGKLGSRKSRAIILCFHTLVIAFQVIRVAG